jgi:carboxypeptidase Q
MLAVLAMVASITQAHAEEGTPSAVVEALQRAALASNEAYDELRVLCDTIGHRLSGSPALDRAIAWAEAALRADGHEVALEPVEVPVWRRGLLTLDERAPLQRPLHALSLGNSVATPPGGIDAEVLVVPSFEAFDKVKDRAKDRIVVWDVPFTTYGETVRYRSEGATVASRAGAVASLVRSVSPISLDTPHTGNQRYASDVRPIPTAAITLEDATRLHRLQEAGVTPRLHLVLEATRAGSAPSSNVVATLRGAEAPSDVVVLGCHLDSWDVGQGAQDDGAGCVTVMAALDLLRQLPTPPRRTVRAVLYTNEENGLAGGKAYAAAHANERTLYAIEDDTGSGRPLGLGIEVETPNGDADPARAAAIAASLAPLAQLLAPLGASDVSPGHSGADISPLLPQGTIGLGLSHDMTGYWPIHHTEADTFDKVDPERVRQNVAVLATAAWYLANQAPDPRPAPEPQRARRR